jgi:protein-tyrosine phosphatase
LETAPYSRRPVDGNGCSCSIFYMTTRELIFEGTFNTRDLGGLATTAGSRTCFRSVIRSDAPDEFTADDWLKLENYGVRTLIDLRNSDEIGRRDWPGEFERIHIPLDGGADAGFWAEWRDTGKWCTPLYYKAHLQRFPDLTAQVVKAVAQAPPGGIFLHCGVGRDRTGLIAVVLLQIAGVSAIEAASDHELSHSGLSRLYCKRGVRDDREIVDGLMRASGKSTLEIVNEIFQTLDVRSLMVANGCSLSDLAAIEARLTGA